LAILLNPIRDINENVVGRNNTAYVSASNSAKEQSPSLSELKFLLKNIDVANVCEDRILSMGYSKRAEGVYISDVLLARKKPNSWVHVNRFGKLSNVSFSTANKSSWDLIVAQLKKEASAKRFKPYENCSFETYKYITGKYTFETWLPLKGVDLSLNNLYKVVIYNN